MKMVSLMKVELNLFMDCLIVGVLSLVIVATAWPQADSDRVSGGEQIYSEKRCALCHVIQGKGGKAGPDLSDVGAKREVQWLEQFMIAPSAIVPNAKMPAFKGSAEERAALIVYLRSLN